MTETVDSTVTRRRVWNPTRCPVTVKFSGIPQTPKTLVQAALTNRSLNLSVQDESGRVIDVLFAEDRKLFGQNSTQTSSTSTLVSHCHFSGFSEFGRHALSLCNSDDIAGLFMTDNNRYGLFAVENSFYLKPYVEDNCNFGSPTRKKRAANTVINRNPSYIKEHLDGRRRYVELALVADYSIYAKYDSDETRVNDYLQKTLNILNSLYYPLNIQVTLVHSEIWKKGDQIKVIANSGETLSSFMEYKKNMLKDHLFDTGYLVTTLRFDDGVVGKAYKGTMCSYDYSGGVYVDHNEDHVETVATFAHELGHTFGMDHDPDDSEVCYCPMPKCIMAPQSGHMEVWSECSIKNLASGFHRGIDLCLFNEPGKKSSDAKCGNGIVETGEECDCGPLKCDNACCDGKTCKLIGDALCASGECCDIKTCKPKPRATVCRASIGICDLEEYCNGETNECPADFFVQNGASCPGRENESCFEGGCGSRNDQCSKLWGITGKGADDNCYRRNVEGNVYGNCGYNPHTKEYKKCESENAKCGLLHCETQAERPIYGDPGSVIFTHSAVYSAAKADDKKFCYVFKSSYGGLNQPDPGLVPDGASCGPEDMCIGQKCQKKSKIAKVSPQCLDECNFRGVCNNVGNCHCDRGFGGIACEIPGYGGSVNSNEAYRFRGITLSTTFLLLFILFGFGIAALCVYYRVKRKRNLLSEWYRDIRKKFDLHGDLVPVRKAPPPPFAQKIRRSLTAMWGDDHSQPTVQQPHRNCYNACCRQLPKFDPPSIPMVTLNHHELSSPTPLLHNNMPTTAELHAVAPEKSRPSSASSFNRTGTMRPTVQPPPIPRPSDEALSKLREEMNDEKFEKLTAKSQTLPTPPALPATKPKSSTLRRNESIRPDVPPPPPPAHKKPVPMDPKPPVPSKPPKIVNATPETDNLVDVEEEKVDVRSMAAMFNQRLKK